jgi:GNAT superfamily N-acetyltransferase
MEKKYVGQFILMINVRFISLIVDKNDRMVGIGVTVPTMGKAAKKSRGRLFPFGWARILYAPYSKPDTLELYLVGVLDEYKNKGLPAILMTEIMREAIKDGMKYAETGPMLEENIKIQSLWKRFDKVQHRRRRCWIKTL